MRVYFEDNTYESLNDSHFISQGGQGSVYGKDGYAYKIYTDIKHAIPESKINELSNIENEDVIKPQYALFNKKGDCIGYAMKQVCSNISLCQLFNHSYKTKHNISNSIILHLIEDIQKKVIQIHEKDILIVDFNEMNFLVDENDYTKCYFIDVDSYQTPSHPAGAIAEHIKDRHTKGFSKLSDWFSFSIIAFRLMTGVHPYKGRHGVYKQLNDRMLANVSAFNKDVKLPAICPSFEVIPDKFRKWLENVLENGERSIPPTISVSNIIVPKYLVSTVSGLGNFKITPQKEFKESILRFYETEKERIYVMPQKTWIDNYEISEKYDNIHQENNITYLARKIDKNKLKIYDYVNKKEILNTIEVDKIFNINNTLCYKKNGAIYKIKINPIGKGIVTTQLLCNVMANSTQIFDNVLIQDLLGQYFVSIFDRNMGHYSIKVPEINKYKLIDAKYENRVLIIKAAKTIEHNEKTMVVTDKFIIVFNKNFDKYSIRKIEDANDEDINFAVIESKNIACHIRKDSIELFSNDINLCSQIKEVKEDDTSSFIATKSLTFLTAINDNKLITITMEKK